VRGGAARVLARGWLRDGKRWTWGSAFVLAGALGAMLATSGLLDGTRGATLADVADFYAGDLRVTPVSTGAIPTGIFFLNGTDGHPGPVQEMKAHGAAVSARMEAQFVLSRAGLFSNILYTYSHHGQFPIDTPGQNSEAGNRTLAIGGLIGLEPGDASASRIERHLTGGRLPRPTDDGTVELAMSEARLWSLLTPSEREGIPDPVPLALATSLTFEVTSAQTKLDSGFHDVIRPPARIVGLYATGIDTLDTFTLVAAAPQVRELLGHPAHEGIANVLVVQSGAAGAREVAASHGWATQDTESFAGAYVGELMAVLSFAAFLVSGLLFLLPTFLVSHGIARQLAIQQRELAVCTAIGVPVRTLRRALGLQVARIAAAGAAAAAVLCLLLLVAGPALLANVHDAPLPLGFAVSWATLGIALAVTVVAMLIGWGLGLRSRSRLPLAAQLRAG
jgi:hypothetical protein